MNLSEIDIQSIRPARDVAEQITDRIPTGPLGAVGQGNIAGFVGFVAVESGEIVTLPIPGLTRPGFRTVSHGMEQIGENEQRHTIVIHAASRDVAEFAAQYNAAPSNLDFLRGAVAIVDVDELDRDAGYSTYEITMDVDRRAVEQFFETEGDVQMAARDGSESDSIRLLG